MVRVDLTLFCVCIPLIFGAPVDESVKQQLTSGLFRNDDGYWHMINPETIGDNRYNSNEPFEIRTRGGGLDSLGGGNILRNLNSLDGAGEWGNTKSSSWRIDSQRQPGYSNKRGGGLDSLGHGNILRHINNYDDEQMYNLARSLTSLGKGLRGGTIVGGHPLRRLDSSPYGLQKKFDSLSGSTFGQQKRNFDEIDRAGFGTFVKKNFDEIDRVGLGFNKRNFDEIDRTGFGSFV